MAEHSGRAISPLAVGLAALAVPATAALAGLTGWPLAGACVFGWVLLALTVGDLDRMVLPDYLTLPLIPAGLAEAWFGHGSASLEDRAIGAAAGYLAFAGLRLVYRHWRGLEGIGGGDVKLLTAAGAWIGWAGLPILVLVAAAMALAVVVADRRKAIRADRPVPFGAYLCLALWAIWLYGPLALD